MTTHPINPLARGGYLVTVKRDGRPAIVKYAQTHQEAAEIRDAIYEDCLKRREFIIGLEITPTGGAE